MKMCNFATLAALLAVPALSVAYGLDQSNPKSVLQQQIRIFRSASSSLSACFSKADIPKTEAAIRKLIKDQNMLNAATKAMSMEQLEALQELRDGKHAKSLEKAQNSFANALVKFSDTLGDDAEELSSLLTELRGLIDSGPA